MRWSLVLLAVVACAARGVFSACAPGTVVGPCLCMEDAAQNFALECSNVTNGSQITDVLEQIQVVTVSSLDITNSPLLLIMPDEAFGTTAVQHIRFYNSGLQSLSAAVFSGPTASSLLSLYVKYCRAFTDLDSSLISALPALEELYIASNGLSSLSDPLPSTGLRYIDLTFNSIQQIPVNYFANAQNLLVVLLGFNSLTSEAFFNSSQSFSAPDQDLYLDLGWNSISGGLQGLDFPNAAPRELILSGNGISELTSAAFSDLMEKMAAQYEGLSPYILLDNNPLLCGCEVAWVTTHAQRGILQQAQCTNGQLLDNLEPADFSDC